MAFADNPPQTLGELIDEVERIREELLVLQRSLEKIEIVATVVSTDEREYA